MNTKVCKNWCDTNKIHECWEEDNNGLKQGWLQSFDKAGKLSYEIYYHNDKLILTIIYYPGYRIIRIPKCNNFCVIQPAILASIELKSPPDTVEYI